MAISMLKIRRPLGRLIFNMGIAIPGKTVFLIETAPCYNIKHIARAMNVYICSEEQSARLNSTIMYFSFLLSLKKIETRKAYTLHAVLLHDMKVLYMVVFNKISMCCALEVRIRNLTSLNTLRWGITVGSLVMQIFAVSFRETWIMLRKRHG